MKKNLMFAMFGAIALTGAVGLSACSSSEDVVDANPTFDGEAVKTQFTISLPFNNNSSTRQTYDVVQEGAVTGTGAEKTVHVDKFRGMSNIVLIPFQSAIATARDARLGDNITLGENKLVKPAITPTSPSTLINNENSIPTGKLLDKSNAVLYNDVTIPVGTAGFLFYGKATGTDGYGNGSLTAAGLEDASPSTNISFTPTPIVSALVNTKGVALATYVSSIAAAKPTTGDEAWWKCAKSGGNQGLGDLYKSFISLKAGASSYVLAAVQDLYYTIKDNTDDISKAIKSAITNGSYVTSINTDPDIAPVGKLTFSSDITEYPGGDNNDMPDGAAALTWTIRADDASSASGPSVASAVTDDESINYGGMNIIKMSTITYPASLYYYANSSIKVSDTSREDDYDGTNTWTQILATYSATQSAVSSTTRSVAITDPVQYAVGRLDVKVNALSAEHYYDRKGEEVSKTYVPNPTSAPSTTAPAFELTGVLIGGQKAVDYKFEPKTSDEYTIYDKTINGADETSGGLPITSSSDAGPTYTLALETAQNTEVYVALEFVNKGADFQGVDGVVKTGCKFYMIAQLNPKSEGGNASDDTATNTGNKVFKQDFKTIANFTFGAGAADGNGDGSADTIAGFGKAYVTIPDLRTPQLELGLSVDLEWQNGVQFDVTF